MSIFSVTAGIQLMVCSIIDEYPNLGSHWQWTRITLSCMILPRTTGQRTSSQARKTAFMLNRDFDFSKEKIGDYYNEVSRLSTERSCDRAVLAYITDTEKGNGTKRLIFSTIFSEDLKVFYEEDHSSSDQTDHDSIVTIFRCYLYMPFDGRSKFGYYDQKTPWSFATIWHGVARE